MKRISSGGTYEQRFGYCRAVVAAGCIHVAGTTAQGDDIPGDIVGQARNALDAIGEVLSDQGASFADAIRVRYYVVDRREFSECAPLLAATFGENPPAATMIECTLIDPKYRIEIELTALAPTPE